MVKVHLQPLVVLPSNCVFEDLDVVRDCSPKQLRPLCGLQRYPLRERGTEREKERGSFQKNRTSRKDREAEESKKERDTKPPASLSLSLYALSDASDSSAERWKESSSTWMRKSTSNLPAQNSIICTPAYPQSSKSEERKEPQIISDCTYIEKSKGSIHR